MKHAEKKNCTAELEHSKEVVRLPLPPCAESTPSFEPREEPLHLPTAFVASERTAVLPAFARAFPATPWCYELDVSLSRKALLKPLVIPCFVAD